MSIPIVTKVRVVSKWAKDGVDKNGNPRTYYNMKVADIINYDSQSISVNKDIFDQAVEGKDIQLKGVCGGINNDRFWYFNEVAK